ncbi:MAG: gamma-glutamyl-gamma-aminobutyrate hydrolase family protein [Planctomycetota bacterium]|nr:gamma-glutamyl-gamma-aminobutyrate hydrolase family protein [Planctomycetota bacterium]
MKKRPLIGITADLVGDYARNRRTYIDMVAAAGGVPVLLPTIAALREEMLDRVDGVVITGGDDIDVSKFGIPLHPKAECMAAERQEAEFALLRALDARPDKPVLGICLGMQMMGVHRGNPLIQHLGDVLPDADRHRNDAIHPVEAERGSLLKSGAVRSWHHQAISEAKGFDIIARSDDGVIEGIIDPKRRFYLGVQWHPERTEATETGLGVVQTLVEHAR